jgi:peptidoglycan/LPS O-acetylase OafA/YrhL
MTPEAFFDKVTFLAFFAVLIPLSYAIHHFYERPAQHFIRKGMESLLTRRPATG